MPHPRHHGTLPDGNDQEAPSPRLPAGGCYGFVRGPGRRGGGGYRRLDSVSSAAAAAARAVRVEVGTTKAGRVVFDVDPAVLEAEPVRRLMEAAGRRVPGAGGDAVAVAVAVDALLFEHLLWLATTNDDGGGSTDDLSEIVEFYSQEEDDDDGHVFKC